MNSNDYPNDDAVSFSLVCIDCDAGMEIASLEAALAAGWTDIEFCPHLPMANYVGICPACHASESASS